MARLYCTGWVGSCTCQCNLDAGVCFVPQLSWVSDSPGTAIPLTLLSLCCTPLPILLVPLKMDGIYELVLAQIFSLPSPPLHLRYKLHVPCPAGSLPPEPAAPPPPCRSRLNMLQTAQQREVPSSAPSGAGGLLVPGSVLQTNPANLTSHCSAAPGEHASKLCVTVTPHCSWRLWYP